MEQKTPEQEMEYQRMLRKRIRMRKRRRKVYIARGIVGFCGVLLLLLLGFGIRGLAGLVSGGGTGSGGEASAKPTATPFEVEVPKGYEQIYQKLLVMKKDYKQIDDILISLERYPKDVLELLVKNPETIDFVSDYLKHVNDEAATGEITEEEMSQVIPLFQQWDKRWGYVKYGSNIIAIAGCGPTCMSMVYTGLTEQSDMSPAQMANFCMENDYYTEDSGTSWSFMKNGAEKLGLSVEQIPLSETQVKEKLKAQEASKVGQPLICSMKPGDFTTSGHFIVLRGISEDGKVLLNDPNSRENSEKEWDFDVVFNQIKAIWAYSYNKQEETVLPDE